MPTKIKTYKNERKANSDINWMELLGWHVVSVQAVAGKRSLVKTAALGAIFLPLALAGKKRGRVIVTYSK